VGVRSAAEVDMNEYTRRMEEPVAASGEQDGGGGGGGEGADVDANVDRPWRDVE
jgi:hypothetical protein